MTKIHIKENKTIYQLLPDQILGWTNIEILGTRNYQMKIYYQYINTFVPSITGRHRMLALRASIAPDKEIQCSFSNAVHCSRDIIYKFSKKERLRN